MGDNAEQVERHIQERRNNLTNDLSELERKAKEAVDWRAQVDQRPGTMLGIAFGAGILLSAILGGGRRSPARTIDQRSGDKSVSPLNPYTSDSNANYQAEMASGDERGDSPVNRTLDNVKGALMGVVLAKCEDFLEEVLPGFGAEYRKAEARNKTNVPPAGGSIN